MTSDEPRDPLAGFEDDVGFQVAFLEEDLLNRVAFRVLQYRRAGGLSQAGLAELMQTQQPAIARIEAGEANLTLRTVAQLAFFLGCEPEELVCESEPESLQARWRRQDEPRGMEDLPVLAPNEGMIS
jgi:ribosome-binding protein aMBF1 (putative translation factor)